MGSSSTGGRSPPAEPMDFGDTPPDPKGDAAFRGVLLAWLEGLVVGAGVFLFGLVGPVVLLARIGCLLGGGALGAYSGFRVVRQLRDRAAWEEGSLEEDLGF